MQWQRGPAESMSLLARIVDGSLDPGYRKFHEGGARKNSWWMQALIFLICVALMLGATIAAKSLRSVASAGPAVTGRLQDEVLRRQLTVEDLEAGNEELATTLQGLEGQEGARRPADPALDVASSQGRVEGPGAVVTLTETVTTGGSGAVRDTQIRAVVNSLWAGGAEAVAVNGQRVGPQTNIRTAGSSILVNLKAVQPPYVIEAIGDPTKLLAAVHSGPAASGVGSSAGMSVSAVQSQHLILGPVAPNQLWNVKVPEGETTKEEGEGT